MRRVVYSPTFARSERLSSLLTYVCEMTLKGRAAEINEQKIGQHVFGRPQDYDSTSDGIVRTQASRLRHRLERYFEQEGAEEPVRIVIPRGGYVPVFEPRTAIVSPPPSTETPAPQSAASPAAPAVSNPHSRVWLPWALCAVLALAVVLLAAHEYAQFRSARNAAVPVHPLWSRVFLKDRPTMIAAADSGLVMFHNMSARTLELEEYLQGDYRKPPPASVVFGPGTPEKIWLATWPIAATPRLSILKSSSICNRRRRRCRASCRSGTAGTCGPTISSPAMPFFSEPPKPIPGWNSSSAI